MSKMNFSSILNNFKDLNRVLVIFCEDSMGFFEPSVFSRDLAVSCRIREHLDDIIFTVIFSEKEKEIMSKYKISVGDGNCFTFSISKEYILRLVFPPNFGMSNKTSSPLFTPHLRIGLTEEAWADFNSLPMKKWIFGK